MSPRLARTLLVLTGTATAGYAVGWFARAYIWTPLILLAVVAVAAWAAGWMWAWVRLADETAAAVKERDEACRIAVAVREGQRFGVVPLHRDVRRVPRQGQR